jgi:hypothetical protein
MNKHFRNVVTRREFCHMFSSLVCVMLCFQYFNQLRENIIRSQPPDKQAAMAQWFENLMDGIERNLLTKNRDRLVSYDNNRCKYSVKI